MTAPALTYNEYLYGTMWSSIITGVVKDKESQNPNIVKDIQQAFNTPVSSEKGLSPGLDKLLQGDADYAQYKDDYIESYQALRSKGWTYVGYQDTGREIYGNKDSVNAFVKGSGENQNLLVTADGTNELGDWGGNLVEGSGIWPKDSYNNLDTFVKSFTNPGQEYENATLSLGAHSRGAFPAQLYGMLHQDVEVVNFDPAGYANDLASDSEAIRNGLPPFSNYYSNIYNAHTQYSPLYSLLNHPGTGYYIPGVQSKGPGFHFGDYNFYKANHTIRSLSNWKLPANFGNPTLNGLALKPGILSHDLQGILNQEGTASGTGGQIRVKLPFNTSSTNRNINKIAKTLSNQMPEERHNGATNPTKPPIAPTSPSDNSNDENQSQGNLGQPKVEPEPTSGTVRHAPPPSIPTIPPSLRPRCGFWCQLSKLFTGFNFGFNIEPYRSDSHPSIFVPQSSSFSSNPAAGWNSGTGWASFIPPLILDLQGNGVETISYEDSKAMFNLQGDGFVHKTSWASKNDALLAA